MTTQKLFKRRVRERMTKTGESYAAARRHVADQRERVASTRAAAQAPIDLGPALELASEAALRKATGRGWEEWLSVLDRWGAKTRKHGEIADFLRNDLGAPDWWTQTITNGFERTRGIRAKHQQADGFTIYASKTVGVSLDALFEAFLDDAKRAAWLADGSMSVRSLQAGKIARFDWAADATRVMVTFEAKGPAKATAHVVHERLPDAEAAEASKAAWKPRLAALKSLLEAAAPTP